MEKIERPFPSRGLPQRGAEKPPVPKEVRRALERAREFKRNPKWKEKDVKELAREMLGPEKRAYIPKEKLKILRKAGVLKRGESGITAQKLLKKVRAIEELGAEGQVKLRVPYRRGRETAYPKGIVKKFQKETLATLTPKDQGPTEDELRAQRRVEEMRREISANRLTALQPKTELTPPEPLGLGQSPIAGPSPEGAGPTELPPGEPASGASPVALQGGGVGERAQEDTAPAPDDENVPQVFFTEEQGSQATEGSPTDTTPQDDDESSGAPPAEDLEIG